MEQLKKFYEDGNYEALIDASQFAGDYDSLVLRANAFLRLRKFDEAKEALEQSVAAYNGENFLDETETFGAFVDLYGEMLYDTLQLGVSRFDEGVEKKELDVEMITKFQTYLLRYPGAINELMDTYNEGLEMTVFALPAVKSQDHYLKCMLASGKAGVEMMEKGINGFLDDEPDEADSEAHNLWLGIIHSYGKYGAILATLGTSVNVLMDDVRKNNNTEILAQVKANVETLTAALEYKKEKNGQVVRFYNYGTKNRQTCINYLELMHKTLKDTMILDFALPSIPTLNDPAAQPANTQKSGGCYIATAVYGSYDCPQVWTLRRFRDDRLAANWFGRVFIRCYYAVSPTLVKWFGDTAWFKKLWKGSLDRLVNKLRAEGVEETPYEDKVW